MWVEPPAGAPVAAGRVSAPPDSRGRTLVGTRNLARSVLGIGRTGVHPVMTTTRRVAMGA